MTQKTYKFNCGLTATQSELTLRQDISISNLLLSLLPENDPDSINIPQLLKKLFHDEKNVIELLSIILNIKEPTEKEKLLDLTNEELTEVLSDFFTLNQRSLSFISNSKLKSESMDPILNMLASKLNQN